MTAVGIPQVRIADMTDPLKRLAELDAEREKIMESYSAAAVDRIGDIVAEIKKLVEEGKTLAKNAGVEFYLGGTFGYGMGDLAYRRNTDEWHNSSEGC